MKYYQRNGVDYITDLVWQDQIPGEKFNLKKYRDTCKFDFYCKTNKLGKTYGFGRYPRDNDNNIILKLKKPVSLAVNIIESVDISIDKGINVFICFCFDPENQTYGYVFIYNGTILPEDGEFIGSLDQVKAKIKQLSKQFKAQVAFIPDDVPLFSDSVFEYETGLDIRVLRSHIDEETEVVTPASEHNFWKHARWKLSRSRIHNLDNKAQKKLVIALFVLFTAAISGIGIKYYAFPDVALEDINENVVQPSAYPAKVFINACLSKFERVNLNTTTWQTSTFRCTPKGIEVTYQNVDGTVKELQDIIGQKVSYKNGIASLKLNISLPDISPVPSNKDAINMSELLQLNAGKLGFSVHINEKKFDITSGYSPVFLYENGIINQLNLSEISMTPDANTGFMSWKILGELNAK